MQLNTYKNAPHPPVLPIIRTVPLSNIPTMISSTTPYKLAEIIQDTWPQLYRPMKKDYNKKRDSNLNKEV